MKLIYLTALLMFFTNIWCPKGILFPFVYMWQRIGLKGWILLEVPIIIQSKQFITKQFTHLLKISFCKNCRKHKQKRSWEKGNNKNYEVTVFSTGVKTWLVCVARGWQQWQTHFFGDHTPSHCKAGVAFMELKLLSPWAQQRLCRMDTVKRWDRK